MYIKGTYDLLTLCDGEYVHLIDSKFFLVHTSSVLTIAVDGVVEGLGFTDSHEMKFTFTACLVDGKDVKLVGIGDP